LANKALRDSTLERLKSSNPSYWHYWAIAGGSFASIGFVGLRLTGTDQTQKPKNNA
jgi:hypothetical protein